MIMSVDDLRSSLALVNPKDDEDRHRYIKYLNDELKEERQIKGRATIIRMLEANIGKLKKMKFNG